MPDIYLYPSAASEKDITLRYVGSTIVDLMEGGAVRASWTIESIIAAVTSTLSMTQNERTSITDWSNLRVRLRRMNGPVTVTQIYLLTPAQVFLFRFNAVIGQAVNRSNTY